MMALAGLYFLDERFVCMTQASCDHLKDIHTRMPVFLDDQTIFEWLDCKNSFNYCEKLINKSKVYESVESY